MMLCTPVCEPCEYCRWEGAEWGGLCDKAGWGLEPDMSQEKPGHICNHPEFKRVIYSQSVVKVELLKMPVGLCWVTEQYRQIIFIFSLSPVLFSLPFPFFSLSLSCFSLFPLITLYISRCCFCASPVWHLLTHAGEHISLLHSSALTSGRWLNFEALRRLPLSSSSSWVVYLWPQLSVTPRLRGGGGCGGGLGGLRTFCAFLLFV